VYSVSTTAPNFKKLTLARKNFIKELSREFLYNLVNDLDLDPRPHTDDGNGRIDGQTNERGRHIKRFFFTSERKPRTVM